MSAEDGDAQAGLEIGRSLEQAREERGFSLKQVEEATKIRAGYLRNLELENFDVLPAVYVLGSLKTYADHLGLDGKSLVRELKRRHEKQLAATHDETAESDPGWALASFGGLAGRGTDEDDDYEAAPILSSGLDRLYLVVGASLVFVLTLMTLVVTLARDDQPAISQVRDPAIAQAPSRIALVGNTENRPDRQPQRQKSASTADDKKDNGRETGDERKDEKNSSDKKAGSSDKGKKDGGEREKKGEEDPSVSVFAQASPVATASPSPTIEAEPVATGPTTIASASPVPVAPVEPAPEPAPAPVIVEPAATEEPAVTKPVATPIIAQPATAPAVTEPSPAPVITVEPSPEPVVVEPDVEPVTVEPSPAPSPAEPIIVEQNTAPAITEPTTAPVIVEPDTAPVIVEPDTAPASPAPTEIQPQPVPGTSETPVYAPAPAPVPVTGQTGSSVPPSGGSGVEGVELAEADRISNQISEDVADTVNEALDNAGVAGQQFP